MTGKMTMEHEEHLEDESELDEVEEILTWQAVS